jgi:DDE superfamily endonuclease
VSAECVAAMEDVLDLYEEPYDPKRPKVNFDETSKPLIAETRVPLPAKPGKPALYDYEYQRNGTRNLFMCCEPQVGWRHIVVTEHRTMRDFAHHMQGLVDERDPEADMIRVVLDNLNTHTPASLSEAFEPVEARRILKKRAFHDTPKHGSWLNRAEIELSILQGQCLERRLPDDAMLTREITAYEDARNAAQATIVWRFTTTKAREKLRRLYPSNSK